MGKTTVTIPEGVTCDVNSRVVTVKGPRGSLTRSFKHIQVDIFKLDEKTVKVEKWNCSSKEQAVIKTVSSHIMNLCIGVTKGYKYRMKLVFAHFPVNVQIANDKKSMDIVISGNDIENVGLTCSRISQSCAVRNKDIRKFLDGIYVMSKGHVVEDEE